MITRRLTKLKNVARVSSLVKLAHGSEITLPPGATLENVNVEDVSYLKSCGKFEVKEDLTEVGLPTGKQRLDD